MQNFSISDRSDIQEIRSELININEELQSVINTAQVNSEEIVENKTLALTNESRIEALTASLQGTDDVAIQTNRRITNSESIWSLCFKNES